MNLKSLDEIAKISNGKKFVWSTVNQAMQAIIKCPRAINTTKIFKYIYSTNPNLGGLFKGSFWGGGGGG